MENTLENKAKFFEIWMDIPNYEKVYQVSNMGNVRRWKPHLNKYNAVKPYMDKSGYLKVGLCVKYNRKMFLVHRLVATCFLYKKDYYSEVNHKDGDKRNNGASNLEWTSRSNNISHAIKTGLKIGINKRDEKGRIAKGNQS